MEFFNLNQLKISFTSFTFYLLAPLDVSNIFIYNSLNLLSFTTRQIFKFNFKTLLAEHGKGRRRGGGIKKEEKQWRKKEEEVEKWEGGGRNEDKKKHILMVEHGRRKRN